MNINELTNLISLYDKFILDQYGEKCEDYFGECIVCNAYRIRDRIKECLLETAEQLE